MEKILIVEDDIAFGTMIQTWLRKKGFEVEKIQEMIDRLNNQEFTRFWP